MKNTNFRIITICMILFLMLSFTGCMNPLKRLHKIPDKPSSVRLYDNHGKFIEKVRDSLNVPDTAGITYDMDEPRYQPSLEAETVYVVFVENNKTVASAECYTENGGLAGSVMMYAPPEPEPSGGQSSVEPPSVPDEPDISEPPQSEKNQNEYDNVAYNAYTNSRYGYTVYYPDFLIAQAESDNSDGRHFISDDGTVDMVVWGSHTPKVFNEASTFDGLYDYTKSNLGYTPTYTNKDEKSGFFVLSGYSGDDIIYEKHFFKSDLTENVLLIRYPKSLKKEFDDIVTYISHSMHTGYGADSPAEY